MKFAVLALLLCLASVAAFAATSDQPASLIPAARQVDKLVFKNYGFAIAPLDEPSKEGFCGVLCMTLAGSEGFAPNVSVTTERFAGTMADYAAKTRKRFDGQHSKIILFKTEGDSLVAEESNSSEGKNSRSYQRAVLKGGTVYTAIAMATEDQWKDCGAKLKARVDSFEAVPAAPSAGKLVFKNNGFSIASLEEPAPTGARHVLWMFLPRSHGATANVGVMVLQYARGISDLLDSCKKRTEGANIKVLVARTDGDTMLLEYSEAAEGGDAHTYQRAMLKAGTLYIVTGLARESQWPDAGPKLKACVDSLEILATVKPPVPVAKPASSAEGAK